jgi:hypothetical protein
MKPIMDRFVIELCRVAVGVATGGWTYVFTALVPEAGHSRPGLPPPLPRADDHQAAGRVNHVTATMAAAKPLNAAGTSLGKVGLLRISGAPVSMVQSQYGSAGLVRMAGDARR